MKLFKTIGVLIVGAISLLYLLNPGAGVIELIPDNLPVVGNLDEAGAVVLLIQCLRYFGLGGGRPDNREQPHERKQV